MVGGTMVGARFDNIASAFGLQVRRAKRAVRFPLSSAHCPLVQSSADASGVRA
jgi:hypothetical protein